MRTIGLLVAPYVPSSSSRLQGHTPEMWEWRLYRDEESAAAFRYGRVQGCFGDAVKAGDAAARAGGGYARPLWFKRSTWALVEYEVPA